MSNRYILVFDSVHAEIGVDVVGNFDGAFLSPFQIVLSDSVLDKLLSVVWPAFRVLCHDSVIKVVSLLLQSEIVFSIIVHPKLILGFFQIDAFRHLVFKFLNFVVFEPFFLD